MFEPNGFIKLHRRLLNWGWYSDPAVKAVFIHLLLTATFVPREWKGITLCTGQTVVSIDGLSKTLGLSVRQVRTALDKLKKTGEITAEATNRYTLVTVVNWAKFQHQEDSETNRRQADDIQTADGRHQYNKYKNKKKYKNFYYDGEPTSYDIKLFEEKARELPVYVSHRVKESQDSI